MCRKLENMGFLYLCRYIVKDTEESPFTAVLDGEITGIRFGLARRDEMRL